MSTQTTRYNVNYNVLNRYDGKKFLGSRTYPIVLPDVTDIIYITNESDYLDTLAFKFYKDSSLWWIIALVNNLGNGRMSIPSGTQLHIPTRVSEILVEYNRLNS